MALSILHRASGIALGVGTLLLLWWLVSVAASPEAFEAFQVFMGSALGLLLLFGWSTALIFHFYAGIRHLIWDAGYGFDAPVYNTSGWAVIVATAVTTIAVWVVGLAVW